MTSLQSWLSKPRASVRIHATVSWTAWLRVLRRRFAGRPAVPRTRIETLDRLSLGGRKSLLLIAIDGQRLLVGVGEDGAPTVSVINNSRRPSGSRAVSRRARTLHTRRSAR
jgi:flagellar biogenesis protein FliO